MTAAALRIGVEDEQWTPLVITPVEQTTLTLLAAHQGRLELADATLSTAWAGMEAAPPLFIARLVDARLAWVEEERWLRSHADTIHTAFLSDGKIAVADAEDPRCRAGSESIIHDGAMAASCSCAYHQDGLHRTDGRRRSG